MSHVDKREGADVHAPAPPTSYAVGSDGVAGGMPSFVREET
jgi:hypothetical protein